MAHKVGMLVAPTVLMTSLRARVLALVALAGLAGCAAVPDEETDDGAASASAFTATKSDFKRIDKPEGFPDPWFQPPGEGFLGRYGKCGQAATANLLRLHGEDEHPNKIFVDGGRSIIGMTPNAMVAYLQTRAPAIQARTARANPRDPLGTLLEHLRARQATALVMGIDAVQAHWFTVVGVRGVASDAPRLVVQEDGEYKTISFAIVEENWRQVLTLGEYPYVVVQTPTDAPLFVE